MPKRHTPRLCFAEAVASFRHTFASLSEGWGIGEMALQRMLRHSSIKTQRFYRHPLPEVLRAAAEKVRYQ